MKAKRLLALVLTAALVILPTMTAFAQKETLQSRPKETEEITYLDYVDGEMVEKTIGGKKGASYVVIDKEAEDVLELEEGWYVFEGQKSLNNIDLDGDVRIILKDGCEFTIEPQMPEFYEDRVATPGIHVGENATLTIYAQSISGAEIGRLTVFSLLGGAAIGGGEGEANGKITINGGVISAIGGSGAGIGGGAGGKGGDGDGGPMGMPGTGDQDGGKGGAGGPGEKGAKGGAGRNITINNGFVWAGAYNGGAAIGGGAGGDGGDGGTGGKGGDGGYGASGGDGGDGGKGGAGGTGGSCSNIRINGGTVYAAVEYWHNQSQLTAWSAIGGGAGGCIGANGEDGEPGAGGQAPPASSDQTLTGESGGAKAGENGTASDIIIAKGVQVWVGEFESPAEVTPPAGYDYAEVLTGEVNVMTEYVGVEPEPEPEPEQEAEEPKPESTGTDSEPVSGGTWNMGPGGAWTYRTNGTFRNTWGYVENPFAKNEADRYGWFYFDKNGTMLTGWQFINGKWYYLNTDATNGTLGMCLVNTTTPDGYRVGPDGAWIQ